MSKKIKCYLVGAMTGLTFDEMNEWRKDIEIFVSDIGVDDEIKIINPVDFFNFEMDSSDYTEREVMDFDLKAVEESDILILNRKYAKSIGSAIELGLGSKSWNKPIIAFGKEEVHPWIECCINKNTLNYQDTIEYIKDFYLPILT